MTPLDEGDKRVKSVYCTSLDCLFSPTPCFISFNRKDTNVLLLSTPIDGFFSPRALSISRPTPLIRVLPLGSKEDFFTPLYPP